MNSADRRLCRRFWMYFMVLLLGLFLFPAKGMAAETTAGTQAMTQERQPAQEEQLTREKSLVQEKAAEQEDPAGKTADPGTEVQTVEQESIAAIPSQLTLETSQTGWIKSGDKWWYRESNGSYPKESWKLIKQSWYYFDKDGWMVTGWQDIKNVLYYMDKDGVMLTGWQKIDGKDYYLQPSGALAKDTWIGQYYVDETGVWIKDKEKEEVKSGWAKTDSRWKYYLTDGNTAQNGWQKVSGAWYLFDKEGWMLTGWQKVGTSWYYMASSGAMLTGWQKISGSWYYMEPSGKMLTGWQWIGSKCYYMEPSGAMAADEWVDGYYLDASGVWIPNRVQKAQWVQSGNRWWYQEKDGSYPKLTWKTISGVWYYFDKDGWMLTGWQKINGSWYYMETSGRMTTGWQKIKNVWYYLNNSGQMLTGWQKVSGSWYLLDGSGKMLTGWQQNGGSWYYMESSGRMMTGWQKLSGTWYYLKADGKMVTGWQTIGNYKYYFKSSGAMASSTTVDGIVLNAEGQAIESISGTGTIRGLIETALEPVGETLYVYGGGHDGSKGGDAVRIGVNPQWKKFYDQQGSSYDYTKYRYWHGYGLDCSGLVGWSIYNTLNKEANKSDYSSTSTVMPQMLANRGMGTVTTAAAAFKAGDVVSKSGHVWLIVGSCSDGSVVLIHATPPVVQISGTVAADGTYNSEAVVLAKKYMNQYYPDASKKFNLSTGDKSYLTNVNHFSWSNSSMKDPDGFRNMTADEVLKKIYG